VATMVLLLLINIVSCYSKQICNIYFNISGITTIPGQTSRLSETKPPESRHHTMRQWLSGKNVEITESMKALLKKNHFNFNIIITVI